MVPSRILLGVVLVGVAQAICMVASAAASADVDMVAAPLGQKLDELMISVMLSQRFETQSN